MQLQEKSMMKNSSLERCMLGKKKKKKKKKKEFIFRLFFDFK